MLGDSSLVQVLHRFAKQALTVFGFCLRGSDAQLYTLEIHY